MRTPEETQKVINDAISESIGDMIRATKIKQRDLARIVDMQQSLRRHLNDTFGPLSRLEGWGKKLNKLIMYTMAFELVILRTVVETNVDLVMQGSDPVRGFEWPPDEEEICEEMN